MSTTNASATNYENYLKFHNDEISKAILGQTLTTDVGTSGSYALGTFQNLVRQDIIEDDKRNIEAAWNEIIYNLVNVNFDNGTWKSSLTRIDTGNGACEIMYVTEVELIAQ